MSRRAGFTLMYAGCMGIVVNLGHYDMAAFILVLFIDRCFELVGAQEKA